MLCVHVVGGEEEVEDGGGGRVKWTWHELLRFLQDTGSIFVAHIYPTLPSDLSKAMAGTGLYRISQLRHNVRQLR